METNISLVLAMASRQAYERDDEKIPKDIGDWKVSPTTISSYWGPPIKEPHDQCLIYTHPSGDLIFAFRGTASFQDILADLRIDSAPFSFPDWKMSPADEMEVIEGPFKIYTSMRDQLFAFLSDHPSDNIYITGHSLGGAFAQLFLVDLIYSATGYSKIHCETQASIKAGLDSFVEGYQQGADALTQTEISAIRWASTHDLVPAWPPRGSHLPGPEHELPGVKHPGGAHAINNYISTLKVKFEAFIEKPFKFRTFEEDGTTYHEFYDGLLVPEGSPLYALSDQRIEEVDHMSISLNAGGKDDLFTIQIKGGSTARNKRWNIKWHDITGETHERFIYFEKEHSKGYNSAAPEIHKIQFWE